MKKIMPVIAAFLLAGTAAAAGKALPFKAGDFPDSTTPEAATFRGKIVYKNYCTLCHGPKADGTGRAAKLYNPKPANLILSDKSDQYKELIIRQGGAPLGRSEFMPPWGSELTDEQISDVVAFLGSIRQVTAEAK